MEAQHVVDLGREAIVTLLLIASPVLLAGLVVGLVVGLLQAATQVQEQTVSFVPKLVAMFAVLAISAPWLLSKMLEYTRHLIAEIPQRL